MVVDANSIAVYKDIIATGLLSKRRQEVFQALGQYGPCTANELFRDWKGQNHVVQANFGARLGELRDLGVVDIAENRFCQVTGRMAKVWQISGKYPVKVDRVGVMKCPRCKGKGEVDEEQIIMEL